MNDNALFTVVRDTLTRGLTARNFTAFNVWQNYQPEQQAMSDQPTLYIYKTSDTRYGYPGRREEYDRDAQVMRRIDTEIMIATFQITAALIYETENPEATTPADLLKAAASVANSPEFQTAIQASGANVVRIGQLTNRTTSTDYAGFDQQPYFEIEINHTDIFITEIPAAERIIGRIGRV